MTATYDKAIRISQIHTDSGLGSIIGMTSTDTLVGLQAYLVSEERLNGAVGYQRGAPVAYRLFRQPAHTNAGNRPLVSGWLGTTNNVDRHAIGLVEIVGGSRTHLHLRHLSDDATPAPEPQAVRVLREHLDAAVRDGWAYAEAHQP